jgi:hypothetical protein
MNHSIFVLDGNPTRAAEYHIDRHVSGSIISIIQALTAAHIVIDGEWVARARIPVTMHIPARMRMTEWVRWIRAGSDNYRWMHYLLTDLITEYGMRFQIPHMHLGTAHALRRQPYNMEVKIMTPWPCHSRYPSSDAIESYRLYCVRDCADYAHWTQPAVKPQWWNEMLWANTTRGNEHVA